MNDMKEDSRPYESGPCRETALTSCRNQIKTLRENLKGLEQLEKLLEKVEVGSPLEETIWSLLCAKRFH